MLEGCRVEEVIVGSSGGRLEGRIGLSLSGIVV